MVRNQGDVGCGRAGPELKVGSALKELSVWGLREGKAHSRSGIRAVDLPGARVGGDTHQPWDQAGCPTELREEKRLRALSRSEREPLETREES